MLWQKSIRYHLQVELPDHTACLKRNASYILILLMKEVCWISRKSGLYTLAKTSNFFSTLSNTRKECVFGSVCAHVGDGICLYLHIGMEEKRLVWNKLRYAVSADRILSTCTVRALFQIAQMLILDCCLTAFWYMLFFFLLQDIFLGIKFWNVKTLSLFATAQNNS